MGSTIGGRNVNWPSIKESCPGDWQRNKEIPVDFCLSYFAIYSAMTLISGDLAKLKPHVVSTDQNGILKRRPQSPVQKLLERPNYYQNRIQFIEAWANSKLVSGNTYCLKDYDENGKTYAMYILDPFRTTPMVSPSGEIFYKVKADTLAGIGEDVIIPARNIIHDRSNCIFHPLVGISPLYAACISASMGENIQDNADSFFKNGSTPGGILTAPGAIDDDTAKTMKERWREKFGGRNRGNVAVLGDGLKFEQLQMTAIDSQMIEQLKWTAENIAAIFHVPGYKIGVGTQPTYNNVESMNQIYFQDCLQGRVESMELVMTQGLESDLDAGEKIDFDLINLLRMDTATRYKTWKEGISGGFVAPNWARLQENMEPVEGGDTPYMQNQNWALSALAQRDVEGNLIPAASGENAIINAISEKFKFLEDHLKSMSKSSEEDPSFEEVLAGIENELTILELTGG